MSLVLLTVNLYLSYWISLRLKTRQIYLLLGVLVPISLIFVLLTFKYLESIELISGRKRFQLAFCFTLFLPYSYFLRIWYNTRIKKRIERSDLRPNFKLASKPYLFITATAIFIIQLLIIWLDPARLTL